MTVTELQRALQQRGFDPGPIDGAIGRLTIAAIRAFQAANGLEVDGIAGPLTRAALGRPEPGDLLQSLSMPWFLEAQRCIGITEDVGPGSNPLIIGWARRLDINFSDDETPWCGLFVAHCIGSQVPGEALPANVLGARNWARCGVACPVPQPGAIMVFWRGSPNGGLGHVAFYVGEDAGSYHVLGGNQSNAVNVMRMARERFIEARWPKQAPPPTGAPRRVAADGAVSHNEQ